MAVDVSVFLEGFAVYGASLTGLRRLRSQRSAARLVPGGPWNSPGANDGNRLRRFVFRTRRDDGVGA